MAFDENGDTMTDHKPDNNPPDRDHQEPDVPPCGHVPMRAGCGGCDPGAIAFVRDDGGPWRRADHHRADDETAGGL